MTVDPTSTVRPRRRQPADTRTWLPRRRRSAVRPADGAVRPCGIRCRPAQIRRAGWPGSRSAAFGPQRSPSLRRWSSEVSGFSSPTGGSTIFSTVDA